MQLLPERRVATAARVLGERTELIGDGLLVTGLRRLEQLEALFLEPGGRRLEPLPVGPDLGLRSRLSGLGIHANVDRTSRMTYPGGVVSQWCLQRA